MKLKKDGSLLLECMIALLILPILSLVMIKSYVKDIKSIETRREIRREAILINSIVQEIKFNVKIQDIIEKFENDEFFITVNDNFYENIKNNNILEIPFNSKEKYIDFKIKSKDENRVLMDICFVKNGEKFLKKEVEKLKWMEKRGLKEDIP